MLLKIAKGIFKKAVYNPSSSGQTKSILYSKDDILDYIKQKTIIILKNASDIALYFYNYVKSQVIFIKNNKDNLIELNLKLAINQMYAGNYTDAIFRYRVVLWKSKDNFDALIGLGYLYYNKKNLKKSIKYFSKLQNIHGSSVPEEVNALIEKIQLELNSSKNANTTKASQ